MIRKLVLGTIGVGVAISAIPAYAASPSIQWSDLYVSYRNLWDDAQPGNNPGKGIQENAINLSYANGWTYGSNFMSIDFEQFTNGDKGNCVFCGTPTSGSSEVYVVYQTVFSGNKISGTKDFSFGPVADIGFALDLEYDTQNDQFASYKKFIGFGPQFAIDLPKGFWTIGLQLSHEWDTDAFLPNGNGTNYRIAPEFTTAWLYPFSIGGLDIAFTGYLNVIAPKGVGATGDFNHKTEILAHPKLLFDVGPFVGMDPQKLDLGVGYEYWLHKFGSSADGLRSTGGPGGGTLQNAVFFEIGYHFNP